MKQTLIVFLCTLVLVIITTSLLYRKKNFSKHYFVEKILFFTTSCDIVYTRGDYMFSIRLKELREYKGYSQQAFANKLGFSQSAIGMWESGKREPSFETIKLLANFFSVPVDYLLGNEEKQSSNPENITPDCKILINKYLQLNNIGKDRANEYIDGLLLNKMYTQEDKKEEFVDFDEKVRYIGSDDTIRYAAYGGGVGSDDNTVKHN